MGDRLIGLVDMIGYGFEMMKEEKEGSGVEWSGDLLEKASA